MHAVCFKCGEEKSEAIKLCNHCRALPTTREDLITSFCLTDDCIRKENLLISSKYLKKKGVPPGFHYRVIKKAIELVDALPKDLQISQAFELPESFFDEPLLVE